MTKRILIVRLSAIGDTLLSVPVLTALRRNFPKAELAWVTERASSQLIEGHSCLDKLFVTSKKTFKSPRQFWTLARQIRQWEPDVTLDLQGLTKSSLLAWFSGASQRLGFRRGVFDGRELSTTLNNRLFQPSTSHIVDRGLELLRLLGVQDDKVEFGLPDSEQEELFAEQTLRSLFLDGRFAVINVGAGWPSKIWPSDRYASVAQHLWEQWGIPSLVMWSGDQERMAAEQVTAIANSCASLAPSTTLVQLRGVVRQACLFVGSDTGPMHLAVALGIPTIGMIGPMPLERVAPYGSKNIGIQRERLPDSKSSERRGNCAPMLSISVGDVTAAIDRLVSTTV
ncbi:MAG: glycosyltransferase family 9 protein [Pirellula sp.]